MKNTGITARGYDMNGNGMNVNIKNSSKAHTAQIIKMVP